MALLMTGLRRAPVQSTYDEITNGEDGQLLHASGGQRRHQTARVTSDKKTELKFIDWAQVLQLRKSGSSAGQRIFQRIKKAALMREADDQVRRCAQSCSYAVMSLPINPAAVDALLSAEILQRAIDVEDFRAHFSTAKVRSPHPASVEKTTSNYDTRCYHKYVAVRGHPLDSA